MIVFGLIHLTLLIRIYTFKINKDLFKDEICSYNGIPVLKELKNTATATDEKSNEEAKSVIECECQKGYISTSKQTIFGNKVYCNYQQKSRLTTLFLSITFPYGFDYLYLGHIAGFIIILLFSSTIIIGNCFIFAQAEQKKNLDNEIEYKPKRNPWQYAFIILAIIWLLFIIINITLMGLGIITDGYGEYTYDDLSSLVDDILLRK